MSSDIFSSEDKTVLCLDDVRRMLHISKRKCAYLLKEGLLPCTTTGKKTRQYSILLSDVKALMETPAVLKSVSAPSTPGQKTKLVKQPDLPDDYREQLEDEWYNVPDVLSPTDVEKLTGYSQSAVSGWMTSGKLRTVTVHGSPITAREWLIEFMCKDGRKLNDLRLDNTR